MQLAIDFLLISAFLVFKSAETRFSPIVLEPLARYESPCITTCLDSVIDPEMEIRPSRAVSYAYFMSHLGDICSVISYGKDCIDECDPRFINPFATKSMTVICAEEMAKAADPFKKCLEEKNDLIKKNCVHSCGEVRILRTKVEKLNELVTKNSDASLVEEELYDVRNSECKTIKCMARCSLKEISKECGADHASFFKFYFTQVLQAGKEDLLSSRTAEQILNPKLAECSYALNTSEMFHQQEQ